MFTSTQKQALNALAFLYHDVLLSPLDQSITHVRSKRKRHSPTVLTDDEMERILTQMRGTHLLLARIIYGTGMRLMESNQLRIQELLGHADVKTTEIYKHIMCKDINLLQNPLDRLYG